MGEANHFPGGKYLPLPSKQYPGVSGEKTEGYNWQIEFSKKIKNWQIEAYSFKVSNLSKQ
jgi:hypothetical protein